MVYKLDAAVSAVISSKEDVDKMGKKMKEIKSLNIPVFAEGMIYYRLKLVLGCFHARPLLVCFCCKLLIRRG